MTVAIVIGCVLGYGLFAGVTFAVMPASWRGDDAGPPAVILWPLVLPALLGAWIVMRLRRRGIPEARTVQR